MPPLLYMPPPSEKTLLTRLASVIVVTLLLCGPSADCNYFCPVKGQLWVDSGAESTGVNREGAEGGICPRVVQQERWCKTESPKYYYGQRPQMRVWKSLPNASQQQPVTTKSCDFGCQLVWALVEPMWRLFSRHGALHSFLFRSWWSAKIPRYVTGGMGEDNRGLEG